MNHYKGNFRMNTNDNRLNAHNEIDHIFKDLLPTRNMAERPAQVALCHQMLNAMLEGGIALCDAGTGIGKTYAYLAAGTVYHRFRAASGFPVRPILISTSSIALLSIEAPEPSLAARADSRTGVPTRCRTSQTDSIFLSGPE